MSVGSVVCVVSVAGSLTLTLTLTRHLDAPLVSVEAEAAAVLRELDLAAEECGLLLAAVAELHGHYHRVVERGLRHTPG